MDEPLRILIVIDNFHPLIGGAEHAALESGRALAALGHVDRTVTADYPFYAVFQGSKGKHYVVCNMTGKPLTVRFSDGTRLTAERPGFAVKP